MSRTPHPRDITAAQLAGMAAKSRHQSELTLLVETGRKYLGFFPAHGPRTIEYPWVLANLPGDLAGARILDVGAGLNPLPFALAERGAMVTTLDNHPIVRDGRNRDRWNEWGFLDYHMLDGRIHSVHASYEDWTFPSQFDAIYCVSVIEHLPATLRRRWMSQFDRQLNGTLLLTVDLIRGSDQLWDRSEGRRVDEGGEHGSLNGLLCELGEAGIEAQTPILERQIPGSLVDISLIRGESYRSIHGQGQRRRTPM